MSFDNTNDSITNHYALVLLRHEILMVRRRAFALSPRNTARGAPSRTTQARLWPQSSETHRLRDAPQEGEKQVMTQRDWISGNWVRSSMTSSAYAVAPLVAGEDHGFERDPVGGAPAWIPLG